MRKRSLSLFVPTLNSTAAKFEGIAEEGQNNIKQEEFDNDYYQNYNDEYEQDEEENSGEGDDDAMDPTEHIPDDVEYKNELSTNLDFVRAIYNVYTTENSNSSYRMELRKLGTKPLPGFENMSPKEVKERFAKIHKQFGKYRTFRSLLTDIDVSLTKNLKKFRHPDKPIKPLVPRYLFGQDLKARNEVPPENIRGSYLKWLHDKFNKLSVREKEHYNKKYDKLNENYQRKLNQFYENNPDERPKQIKKKSSQTIITPFNLFFTELKAKKGNVKRVDAVKEWHDLSVKKKIVFIKKAYKSQNEESGTNKVTLTSSELRILDEHNGKPDKPPYNCYLLFKQKYTESDIEVMDPKQAYKTITKAEKDELKQTLESLRHGYVKAMQKYIKKLPAGSKKEAEQNELEKFLTHDKSLSNTTAKNISGGSSTAGSISSPQKGIKRSLSEPREIKSAPVVPAEDAEVEQPPIKKKKKKKTVAVEKATSVQSVKQEVKIKNEKPDNHNKIKKKNEFSTPKPPKTLFKYFVSLKSFETMAHAKLKFKKLSKSEKAKLENEYSNKCNTYINNLRSYMKTLDKNELPEFIKKVKDAENGETDDDEISSYDSDSED